MFHPKLEEIGQPVLKNQPIRFLALVSLTTAKTQLVVTVLITYAKQKHLGYKKGEANQKQQLSDYNHILLHSYKCN